MSSNNALIDSLTTRQIFIERYSKGEATRLFKHLKRLSSTLKKTVSKDYDRVRAIRLAKQISTLTEAIITEYGEDLAKGLTEFAQAEAQFASQAIVAATSAEIINPPSLNQIQSVLTKAKMNLVTGKVNQRLTIDQAVKTFAKNKARGAAQIIRDGATVGKTSQEIISDITNLVDGSVKHQAASLVRTTTNHMASQARAATYAENDDVITGEEYVATLDSHTTVTCASLDGTIYPVGKGVMTPRHWSCRSLRVPVINPEYNLGADVDGKRASSDGEVSAKTTYGGWLKRQSHEVQNEVLGADRATLFRSGKLSIGKFTDDTGKVYSLKELEKLNPLAFKAREAVKRKVVIKKAAFVEFDKSADAADWAVKQGYVESADYGKLDVSVANEMNRSLHDHAQDYPELKKSFSFVGSAQSLNRKMYQAQIDHYTEQAKKLYPDRDPVSIAKRWAKKPRTSGEWAFARGKSNHEAMKGIDGIAFNESYGKKASLSKLKRGLDSSLAAEFHPPKCDTIKSIMDHEMGHQIDYLLELRKDKEVIALYQEWGGNKSTLSGYARENMAEFIAEGWAEYRNNPAPRDISSRLGDIINARYKTRFN